MRVAGLKGVYTKIRYKTLYLHVEQQSFSIGPQFDDQDEVKWHEAMLHLALRKIAAKAIEKNRKAKA